MENGMRLLESKIEKTGNTIYDGAILTKIVVYDGKKYKVVYERHSVTSYTVYVRIWRKVGEKAFWRKLKQGKRSYRIVDMVMLEQILIQANTHHSEPGCLASPGGRTSSDRQQNSLPCPASS